MYVRWKKRARTRRHRPTGEHTLTAVLVTSQRVDGRPRQRIVAYLGSIGEHHTSVYWHQVDFWKSAAQHLEQLDLDADTATRIREQLAQIVPVPTAEGRAQAARQLEDVTRTLSGM